MKAKTALLVLVGIVLIVSISIAESLSQPTTSKDDLTLLRTEVERLSARTSALENEVRTLKQSNAKLERELGSSQQWKVVPVLTKRN